jgi:hypothetical protein
VEPYKYGQDVQLDTPVKPADSEKLEMEFVLKDDGKLSQKK